MTLLAKLKVDFSQISRHLIDQKVGADGIMYYKYDIAMQVTHFSAYTKYELIHQGINYGSVTTEYV